MLHFCRGCIFTDLIFVLACGLEKETFEMPLLDTPLNLYF